MKQQDTKEKENMSIQILRGLAILLILLYHSIARVNGGVILQRISDIIYCIHVPTFFIISGYLYESKLQKYNKEGKCKFIINKAKHLLIPYVFWTVLLWGGSKLHVPLGVQ